MMRKLCKLTSDGRCLVDEHFLSDPTVKVSLDLGELERRQYVEDLKEDIDLSDFNTLVDQIMRKFDPYDTHMDREIAAQLHKTLPLSRREGGDTGTWHYLAVIERPDFVRHRWQPKNGQIARERFLGDLVRNTFARLWWGAEQTFSLVNGYAHTEQLFSRSQDLYEAIFGRKFGWYPQAVLAFINVVGSEKEDIFRKTAKDFNHILTTLVLESMSKTDIEKVLQGIMDPSKARSL